MSKTLIQIKKKIEALERAADAIRKKEIAGVVERIKEAIEFYDLTAEDLGLSGPRSSATPSAKRKPRARIPAESKPVVVRFRDEAGNTWSGRGPRPSWFKSAIESGTSPDDLRV